MAPEQARGKPADRRADIWAFGCVLYEMLTGRRAFEGEDLSETLALVLTKDPDWAALPAALPATVRRLLRRCLERDVRKRVADASTLLFVLDEISGQVSQGGPAADAASAGATDAEAEIAAAVNAARRETVPVMRRRAAVGGAVALAVGGAIVGAGTRWVVLPAPVRVVRTEITTFGPAALFDGIGRDFAITPDGSRLEPQLLGAFGTPRSPFRSPDGQWVGFFDGPALKKVAITGGPAVTLTHLTGASRGATWGRDGTIVYATSSAPALQRVSAVGGDPTPLAAPDRGGYAYQWPELLPGERFLLVTMTPTTAPLDTAEVAVIDLETGMRRTLVRGGSYGQYVSTGHLLYSVGGTLQAIAFDLDRREALGPPVPVVEQVSTAGAGAADLAVAADGTMVYVRGGFGAGAARALTWVDRMGREERLSAPLRAYTYPRISPDGTRVAPDVRGRDSDIWIWHFAQQTLTRLTFDPGGDEYPVWTPDGRRIVFSSGPQFLQNPFWQSADGAGSPVRLTTSSTSDQDPQAIAPDGTLIVFRETATAGAPPDLMSLVLQPNREATANLDPAGEARPLIKTMFAERNAEISPDGRWLAYESNESGRVEVYVRPFPDVSGGRWQVSTGGGRTPLWSRDGRELIFLESDATLMGVEVGSGRSRSSGTPVRVLEGSYFFAPSGNGRSYDISPDGRRFLMVKNDEIAQSLILVQNWTEALKRLVPNR